MLRRPRRDLRLPRLPVGRAPGLVGGSELREDRVHPFEDRPEVADDRQVRRAVLPDLHGIDVHVDDPRVGGEGVEPSRHAVVEAGAQRDDQVGAGHRHVRGVASVHAGHADEVRVAGGEPPEPHQRAHGRRVDRLHEIAQRPRGAGGDHPAAGVDDRATRVPHHLRRPPDLARVSLVGELVSRQVDRSDRLVVRAPQEDVLGNVHQDRARTPAGGDVEGLVDRPRQVGGALHEEVVLRAGAGDAERVRLLERVASDQLRRDLPGDRHDGDRVEQGVDQAGDEVRRPRPRGGAADADLPGRACVSLRHEAGVLLVADEVMLDLGVVEHVVEGEGHAAGVSEEAIDAFPEEALHQDVRAGHQVRHVGSLSG